VEQDALQLLETQLRAGRDALARAGLEGRDVAAIGIANQRETTVAWDADGRPQAPAIVWQDRRTAEQCRALRDAGIEPSVRARTGLVLDPYFSATKMAWLLDQIPDGHARAAHGDLHLGTVDAFLAWHLTGGHTFATDASNASRTLLLDLANLSWAPDLLELFGLPEAALPRVRATDADFGSTLPELFGAPIPIRAMVGDQQAALFGQLCLRPGDAKNTYGTGCFLLMTTGAQVPDAPPGLLATVAWLRRDEGPAYAVEGSVFVAGAAVRWLRDGLGLISESNEVEALAAGVPDAGGVVFVPAFAGLGAPHWDPAARGLITGLTAGVTRAHLARATLDAIAQQTADLVDALDAGGLPPMAHLRADGGAASDLVLQLQADLLGRRIERAAVAETTALGAALLAGRAIGLWGSDSQLAGLLGTGRVFEPRADGAWRSAMRRDWASAISRARTGPTAPYR
jgi:glycerol kinase